MKQISSKATFFQKRVFPSLWFGILTVVLVSIIIGRTKDQHIPWPLVFVPLAMATVGYLMFKVLFFDLADEVHDRGDALLVRRKGKEVTLPLLNIINVSATVFQNPPRITLTLREPCELGKEIAFMPPHRWNMFKPSPVAADLIERIDALRQNRR